MSTLRTTNHFHTPLADTVSGASVDAGAGVFSSVSKKPDLSDFPVSIRTLREWTAKGLLPCHRLSHRCVLFSVKDLERVIGRYRVNEVGGAR